MTTAFFWVIMQGVGVNYCQWFRTTYWSHHKSQNPKDKMGPLAIHIHTKLKRETWHSTSSGQTAGFHYTSHFEYKCCFNLCLIIKHYIAKSTLKLQEMEQYCQSLWNTFILTPISVKHYCFVSYSSPSIGLACKLTRSHAPRILTVRT